MRENIFTTRLKKRETVLQLAHKLCLFCRRSNFYWMWSNLAKNALHLSFVPSFRPFVRSLTRLNNSMFLMQINYSSATTLSTANGRVRERDKKIKSFVLFGVSDSRVVRVISLPANFAWCHFDWRSGYKLDSFNEKSEHKFRNQLTHTYTHAC